MHAFQYQRPTSLDEAVALLATPGVRAAGLAGGTDLLIGLREGRPPVPALVVDIKRVPELATGIRQDSDRLVIGANVVMSDLVDDERVGRHFPALVEAAAVVGSRQIRNRATLAGNIANASPAADTAPPLLAYGAEVRTYGPGGERRLTMQEFFLGPRQTALTAGELVTAIEVAIPREPSGSAFDRLTRRRGSDLASLSVCAYLNAGRAYLACGAVAPRPFVGLDDSGVLTDPTADSAEKDRALRRLVAEALPITDVRASAGYRTAMLLVVARRVIAAALARQEEGKG